MNKEPARRWAAARIFDAKARKLTGGSLPRRMKENFRSGRIIFRSRHFSVKGVPVITSDAQRGSLTSVQGLGIVYMYLLKSKSPDGST